MNPLAFIRRLFGFSPRRSPRGGSVEGPWDLVDARTGKLIIDQDGAAGEPATAEAAMNYHAWFRAINLIAQKVAAVPKHLLKRTESDAGEGKEKAREHPVYKLVHLRANVEQTAFQFWLQMAGHVAARGNAYAAIWRVAGTPDELIPLDPDRTFPVRVDGELWYVCLPFGSDRAIRLRAADVLHFKGLGFDGLIGYAVWELASQELGLARAQISLASARFRNSGRPSIILEFPGKLDDVTKRTIVETWERMVVGLDNAGRTALLDNGLTAKPLALSAEELDQSGAAQMSIVAISNFTGVPVSKLGGGGRSFASQEQEDQAFINDGLDFYLNVFEDETGAKLLTDEELEDGYEVKANRQALLRPATKDQYEVLRIGTGGRPFVKPNEARRILDLPPSDEPDANKLLVPLNMGQGGPDNKPTNLADPDPGRPSGD